MTTTSFRRRAAAVATGTLAAGALSFIPAMAGISTASAATATLNYTCTIPSGFGSQTVAAPVKITVANRESIEKWVESTSVDVTAEFDATKVNLGPVVNRLGGNLAIDLVVAGETTTVTLPVAEWKKEGDPVPPAILKAAKKTFTVDAPAAAGVHDIDVAGVVANLDAYTSFSPAATAMVATCAPDAGQEMTVSTIEVDGSDFNYRCEVDISGTGFGGVETFGATVTHEVELPASAKAGQTFDPAVTASLALSKSFAAFVKTSPATAMDAALSITGTAGTAGTSGAVDLGKWSRNLAPGLPPFAAIGAPVPPVEFSGAGSLGAIKPTAGGSLPVSVTGIKGDMQMYVSFAPTVATPIPVDCVPAAGPIAVGEVAVEKAPVVAAAATKTAVKTAYAKKAKKLTATVTVTSAKAKPAGKATLVLKKGKKQVGKATVNIKNGSAKAVFKKIAKGNYKLTVKYAGNKNFKASSKTITVKVK